MNTYYILVGDREIELWVVVHSNGIGSVGSVGKNIYSHHYYARLQFLLIKYRFVRLVV
ncbi:MAG: hypothetical protein QNJ68_16715 [Microcoleaceae cyanobacterium MO_207.B10]|nr:hypothetical protein [Microcoleaceae cyanobacterium MO_207.B10]